MCISIRSSLIGAMLSLAATAGLAPAEAQRAPPLSARCEAPNIDIAAPAPLPHIARGLARARVLRILAIGSSSTWGVGASSRQHTYPAQLKSILHAALRGVDAEISNRGVSGEVALETAGRLRAEVALHRPDLVLWQVGTNDALSHVPPKEFERTVRATVEWLKSKRIDTALVGLQYTPKLARDERYFAIREALQRVAASEHVLYVRRYEAMAFMARHYGNIAMMSRDGLHLDDLGYRCMAEHIAHAVIVNLFVPKRDLPKERQAAAAKT